MSIGFETEAYCIAGRPTNTLAMNQYIIACKATRRAALIDCGESPERFLAWCEQRRYAT
jgi:hypothetical protein